jgi:ATP phosphoribosyltransferase regulatory subunit HisZ
MDCFHLLCEFGSQRLQISLPLKQLEHFHFQEMLIFRASDLKINCQALLRNFQSQLEKKY